MPDYEICYDCGHAKIECVFYECMCNDVEARIAELEAENERLRMVLETVRDCGLEPIDPAYRRLAAEALAAGEDE